MRRLLSALAEIKELEGAANGTQGNEAHEGEETRAEKDDYSPDFKARFRAAHVEAQAGDEESPGACARA